jgi:hypothetical protein
LSLKKVRATTVIIYLPHISTTICPALSLASISAFPHLRDPIPGASIVAIS